MIVSILLFLLSFQASAVPASKFYQLVCPFYQKSYSNLIIHVQTGLLDGEINEILNSHKRGECTNEKCREKHSRETLYNINLRYFIQNISPAGSPTFPPTNPLSIESTQVKYVPFPKPSKSLCSAENFSSMPSSDSASSLANSSLLLKVEDEQEVYSIFTFCSFFQNLKSLNLIAHAEIQIRKDLGFDFRTITRAINDHLSGECKNPACIHKRILLGPLSSEISSDLEAEIKELAKAPGGGSESSITRLVKKYNVRYSKINYRISYHRRSNKPKDGRPSRRTTIGMNPHHKRQRQSQSKVQDDYLLLDSKDYEAVDSLLSIKGVI